MKKIFCISGLGADERIFSNLILPNYELVFVKWIPPAKNEKISDYAIRMMVQIDDQEPLLLGLSFGGMICIEISKIIPTKGIILISTIKIRKEMPLWMRFVANIRLYKVFQPAAYSFLEPFQNYNLGVKNTTEKSLVRDYRKHIDKRYLNWAIEAILKWENEVIPANVYHIHGSNDRIFQIKRIRANKIIADGGHLMVYNKSEVVSKEILKAIHSFINEC